MALDASKSLDIIEIMENYISKVRPEPEIRNELDLCYEIQDQSVVLCEVRPAYLDPTRSLKLEYAKATFVKSKKIWKLYWMRANGKWDLYDPFPAVKKLEDFLSIVDQDEFGCFKG